MLTLSSKVRYAVRIMAFLARQPAGRAVSAKKISETEDISFDYTEQILIRLTAAQLGKSTRGPQGGFVLTDIPENITVADIIAVIEGDINIISCLAEDCSRAAHCQTKPLWRRANEALKEIFSGVTIADLAQASENGPEEKVVNFEI